MNLFASSSQNRKKPVWFLFSKEKKKLKSYRTKEQELKNYYPIFLLSVSGKIFERLFNGSIFKSFIENSLIMQN